MADLWEKDEVTKTAEAAARRALNDATCRPDRLAEHVAVAVASAVRETITSQEIDKAKAELLIWRRDLLAEGWDEGAATALNHAIRNDDGITLRLEHLDGRPWQNPHRTEVEAPAPTGVPWLLREFVRNGVCLTCGGAVMTDGSHIDPARHDGWARPGTPDA